MKTISRISMILMLAFMAFSVPVSAEPMATATHPDPFVPATINRYFPTALVLLTLSSDPGCAPIVLTGDAADVLQMNASGAADDSNGNGLDDVDTTFTHLSVQGKCGGSVVYLKLRAVTKSRIRPPMVCWRSR